MKNPSTDMVCRRKRKHTGQDKSRQRPEISRVPRRNVARYDERRTGLTFAEIKSAALTHLPDLMFPGGGKLGSWVKSVQLDLEAKGVIKRADTKPLRFYLS